MNLRGEHDIVDHRPGRCYVTPRDGERYGYLTNGGLLCLALLLSGCADQPVRLWSQHTTISPVYSRAAWQEHGFFATRTECERALDELVYEKLLNDVRGAATTSRVQRLPPGAGVVVWYENARQEPMRDIAVACYEGTFDPSNR